VAAAAGAGGYLLASDDDEEAAAPPASPAQAGGRVPAGWTLCSNESAGYAIAYPADWHAPALSAESECTFFDPEPIQLPENSDVYGAALDVAPAQESFDNVVRGLTDPKFEDVLEREDVRIAGRRAVRVESRSTGAGLFEKGLVSATYVVDRGSEPPLVLRAFGAPGGQPRRDVLDRAARSLVLFEPAGPSEDEAPPDAVLRKRAALLAAADAGDYDALAELADPQQFEYTFGGTVEGGPAAYWRQLEQRGDDEPAEVLAAILRMPYTLHRGIYTWPFAFDKAPDELTSYERGLLKPLGEATFFGDSYLGWRAGIRPDGRWVFFIAGD
jgi:hypothetical protein